MLKICLLQLANFYILVNKFYLKLKLNQKNLFYQYYLIRSWSKSSWTRFGRAKSSWTRYGQHSIFRISVLVFVRGVIWHTAEGYNCNIMWHILPFLTHVTALAVGSITSSHSKISAICWYHLFVWISIPLDGAVIYGDMLSIVLNTFLERSSWLYRYSFVR